MLVWTFVVEYMECRLTAWCIIAKEQRVTACTDWLQTDWLQTEPRAHLVNVESVRGGGRVIASSPGRPVAVNKLPGSIKKDDVPTVVIGSTDKLHTGSELNSLSIANHRDTGDTGVPGIREQIQLQGKVSAELCEKQCNLDCM